MIEGMIPHPVLEIGGTHITGALIDPTMWEPVRGSVDRRQIDGTASTASLLDAIADAAGAVRGTHSGHWSVAVPGPFDYEAGIGRFEDVGKFDALRGVDVGRGLRDRLPLNVARSIRFLNDADAFGIGEYAAGAARSYSRAICLTLGTGVGSAFLDHGHPVNSGASVPPDGSAHLILHRGRPLEEIVSRRAIRRAYGEHDSSSGLDVRDIADAALSGQPRAQRAFTDAFRSLGEAIAPWVDRFEPTVIVLGGSISQSWDLVAPPFRAGLTERLPQFDVEVEPARRLEDAGLIGAAFWRAQAND